MIRFSWARTISSGPPKADMRGIRVTCRTDSRRPDAGTRARLQVERIGRRGLLFERGGGPPTAKRTFAPPAQSARRRDPDPGRHRRPLECGAAAPDAEAPDPLTAPQSRPWFHGQPAPGSTTYNLLQPSRLTGPLDVGALRRAFEAFVAWRDVLSPAFDAAGDDLVVLAPERVIAEEARTPFRPARRPALPGPVAARGPGGEKRSHGPLSLHSPARSGPARDEHQRATDAGGAVLWWDASPGDMPRPRPAPGEAAGARRGRSPGGGFRADGRGPPGRHLLTAPPGRTLTGADSTVLDVPSLHVPVTWTVTVSRRYLPRRWNRASVAPATGLPFTSHW